MGTTNVLVTSIGGPVAQGILKGLKEMDDVRIIGADRRLLTAGNLFCDKVYQIPRFSDFSGYMNRIKEVIKEEFIHVVFPGHPMETELYHEYRKQLDIPVALPESPVYNDLLDKEAVYLHMEQYGLYQYIPHYIGFTTNEEFLHLKEQHFPKETHLIVKDVKGYGALGFAIVTDRENFLKAVKSGNRKVTSVEDYLAVTEDTRRILMEKLEQPEYSVDVFVHDGEVVVAVPRKRTGVSNGLVLDGTIEKEEALLEVTEQIAGKLVNSGFFNMQFMHGKDGYKLTDVNPRFCGSQVMSLGAGVNFPKLFIQYAVLGETPVPEPIWGTRMMRYRETYFVRPEDNITENNFEDTKKTVSIKRQSSGLLFQPTTASFYSVRHLTVKKSGSAVSNQENSESKD
uniref:ATP-grasp domain-containing protein n=1 Tax=Atopococcus tabaci TaxID=269774 RepID=UPI00240990BE